VRLVTVSEKIEMTERLENERTVLLIKAAIDDMHPADAAATHELADTLRRLVGQAAQPSPARRGDGSPNGVMAIALVGAEIQALLTPRDPI
jgi:hypothetical protein